LPARSAKRIRFTNHFFFSFGVGTIGFAVKPLLKYGAQNKAVLGRRTERKLAYFAQNSPFHSTALPPAKESLEKSVLTPDLFRRV